jgi:hypothetical protein
LFTQQLDMVKSSNLPFKRADRVDITDILFPPWQPQAAA